MQPRARSDRGAPDEHATSCDPQLSTMTADPPRTADAHRSDLDDVSRRDTVGHRLPRIARCAPCIASATRLPRSGLLFGPASPLRFPGRSLLRRTFPDRGSGGRLLSSPVIPASCAASQTASGTSASHAYSYRELRRLYDRQTGERADHVCDRARIRTVSSISLDAPPVTRTGVPVNRALIFDEARGPAVCARNLACPTISRRRPAIVAQRAGGRAEISCARSETRHRAGGCACETKQRSRSKPRHRAGAWVCESKQRSTSKPRSRLARDNVQERGYARRRSG
jgi:hypothetical protein